MMLVAMKYNPSPRFFLRPLHYQRSNSSLLATNYLAQRRMGAVHREQHTAKFNTHQLLCYLCVLCVLCGKRPWLWLPRCGERGSPIADFATLNPWPKLPIWNAPNVATTSAPSSHRPSAPKMEALSTSAMTLMP